MTDLSREAQVMHMFATLADTLVAGYEVVDLLQTLVDGCFDLLDANAAGILLVDETGSLEVVASTSESSNLVEMMQLGSEFGPGIESFRTGRVVAVPDVRESPTLWQAFRESALRQGFRSAYALPLKLRETTIGTLNLFREAVGAMDVYDETAARAFADVATIGILHERSVREGTLVRDQLQHALSSRIVIEQAKGMVAYTRDISVDEAFTLIRAHARDTQVGISSVAAQIVDRSLSL